MLYFYLENGSFSAGGISGDNIAWFKRKYTLHPAPGSMFNHNLRIHKPVACDGLKEIHAGGKCPQVNFIVCPVNTIGKINQPAQPVQYSYRTDPGIRRNEDQGPCGIRVNPETWARIRWWDSCYNINRYGIRWGMQLAILRNGGYIVFIRWWR